VALAIPALLAGLISVLLPAGRHQWALSLFRQPERYTTLFFNNASDLPSTAALAKPLKISFTVGNHEGHSVVYRFVLSAVADGESQVLGTSTRTVRTGANWRVSGMFRPECRSSPCEIQISLPGYPETIDFQIALKARLRKHH
jgi:hypothetical protein